MLTEERLARILSIVEARGSATVSELMREMGASESTVRRDLLTLDRQGRINRVRGGATSISGDIFTKEDDVSVKRKLHVDEKKLIGNYAVGLIVPGDFVYIDAGTSTSWMLNSDICRDAIYVTNAVDHAMKLSSFGLRVYILGGEFKRNTEAIVGEEAVLSIKKYNFTKGFFGTNGVDPESGFTTPEIGEAAIKHAAMEQCSEKFVLCDSSKFGVRCPVSFADYDQAVIITDKIQAGYEDRSNIREVIG